jgi:hypothetical protein
MMDCTLKDGDVQEPYPGVGSTDGTWFANLWLSHMLQRRVAVFPPAALMIFLSFHPATGAQGGWRLKPRLKASGKWIVPAGGLRGLEAGVSAGKRKRSSAAPEGFWQIALSDRRPAMASIRRGRGETIIRAGGPRWACMDLFRFRGRGR